jgi:hypothetical protein
VSEEVWPGERGGVARAGEVRSSSQTFLRLDCAAATITERPTGVEPVKATLSTSMCEARAWPAAPRETERATPSTLLSQGSHDGPVRSNGGQPLCTRLAKSRHHVEHARWDAGLESELTRAQRRERRLLGHLEDHRVAARQRGAELPRSHQQREVPSCARGRDATCASRDQRHRARSAEGGALRSACARARMMAPTTPIGSSSV